MTSDLWYGALGPRDAQIVLIGEAWGQEEKRQQKPFVGASGQELDRMLFQAGVPRETILTTNLYAGQPLGNEAWRLFEPRAANPSRLRGLAPKPELIAELRRLHLQINEYPRSLIIACGNYPLWAFSSVSKTEVIREAAGRHIPRELQTWGPVGIMNWRGSMLFTEPLDGFELPTIPLLPIVHPAAILRQWPMRDPTVRDLRQRIPQALNGGWSPPKPTFLAPPSFNDCKSVLGTWLRVADREVVRLAVDIETMERRFITCIGLADSPTFAISIPFIRPAIHKEPRCSYWTIEAEVEILDMLRHIFLHPQIEIIGQNFLYDIQYLQQELAVTPYCAFDTMLAQNVLYPGTPKDLGYLSSLYCAHHRYWKEDTKEWDRKIEGLEKHLTYNCTDAVKTWEIAQAQRAVLTATNMMEPFKLKMQIHELCLRMINRGVLIDDTKRAHVMFDLQAAYSELSKELSYVIPQELVGESKTPWFRSAAQTRELFYNILGLGVVSHRKTGRPTVGKEALAALKKKHPEYSGLFRRLDQIGSIDTTIGVLGTALDLDGRMRCSYNPGGTETHRLSSSENAFGRGTNLQNLSKGEEE